MASSDVIKAYKRGKAAREQAAKRGVVTTQRPKPKKKKKKEQPKAANRPETRPHQIQPKGRSNKPQQQKAPQKPMQRAQTLQQKQQKKAQTQQKRPQFQTKVTQFGNKNAASQIQSYKASKYAAKVSNTSKPKSMLEQAQEAYKKGKNRTYLGTDEKTVKTKVGKSTLKSKNALRQADFQRMMTASSLGPQLGNKVLKGNKKLGQKDIREKVGSQTAASAYKSKFATGAMQGSGFADVFTGSVGTYNKAARKAIKKTKSSKAYLGGYVAGQMGGFAMNKTSAMGRAIAGGAAKAGAKGAGKNIGKQFVKNRVGEMVSESPMNMLDAVKMATDEKGKINRKELRKYMALNTGLTGAMGGAMEGVAMKKASSNVKKLTELMGKQRAGRITDDELKQLNKVRDKLRKTVVNSDNLSGDVAQRGLENIKSDVSNARIQRARAKSEARQPRVDAEFEQAKTARKNSRLDAIGRRQEARNAAQRKADYAEDIYNRTESPTKNMTEISAERSKIRRAQKSLDQISATETNAKNLDSRASITAKVKEADELLQDLRARKKNPNVPQKDIDAKIKLAEERLEKLRKQEGEAWRAETQNSRKAALQETIDNANKRIDELSETSQAQKVTPEEAKVIERSDLDRQIERTEKSLKNASDPDDAEVLEQRLENLRAERDGRAAENVSARKEVERTQRELADVDSRLQQAQDALNGALAHAENSRNAHGEVSPQTQAQVDEARKIVNQLKEEQEKASAAAKEASDNMDFAQIEDDYLEEVGLSTKQEIDEAGEAVSKEETNALELKNMKEDLAQIDDEIATTQKKLAEATGDRVGQIRKELDQLRQQRMVIESAISKNHSYQAMKQASDEVGKAITKQKTGFGKLIAKINRGFIDSFGDWESLFRSFDDPELRKEAFARLQKLRMSRSEAGSKVFDEFLDLYERFGLVGKKNKQKLADYERYTFLMHELERSMDGTGFTGMAPDEVAAQIRKFEEQYGKDITEYQQSVVKYFDELLDRDVASGFDTAEHVAELRDKYHNYVPTFRDVDGTDAISSAKPYEEINFHRTYAAVGGDTWDVLPLHVQAMQKTQATLIRQNENELVSFVAQIAQVNKKDLVSGKTPQEYLESATMTMKDPKTGKYSVAYFVDGEKKSLQISEGMYNGIRQWTGEDRAWFMNCKLINTVSGKINRWFKDWITDYSLIFGARNFIRDLETGLFYSSNPVRYAKNIPRAVSCVMADTKMGRALMNSDAVPESFRNYLKEGAALTNAYKKNGGSMSQLVSESDPYVMLKRLHRKNGPLGVIREINGTIEMVPRMAEFASAAEEAAMKRANIPKGEWYKLPHGERLKWLNEAVGDADTLAQAMNRSKEVTLNFDRSGYIGRWLNSTFVPFFNPAIQGGDKLTRVLVRDNHTAAEWARMVTMFGVIGQGSEVLLNTIYAGNEKYERLTDYEKTGYYHIPMEVFGGDKDSFLKIPRAREVAAVQGPMDWYFQHVKYHCAGKDENLFQSFKSNAKMWYEQIGPVNPIEDNVFYAPVRIAQGKTWYGGYIEDFDDQEKVKAGRSDEVWDENTTSVAKGINKMLLNAPDKLKFLGFSDAQIKNMKTHAWSPKKIDDLLDSYLGVIYDMGIKNTSAKNSAMTDSIGKIKEGKFLSGSKGIGDIFTSSFGMAFTVDSVMSNSYKSNQYAKKADLQGQLDNMTKGLEEGSDEYNAVVQSKEYKKVNAQMRRLNQSFAYTSANYDNMMANIYLRDDLTSEQKNFWVRKTKAQQNSLLYGRQQGDDVANADPMKWGYNVKRKDGSRLFTNDQLVDLCSFTYKDGNNAYKDSWNKYKKLNPKDKSGKSWMEITLGQREVNRFTGEPLSMMQYNVGAYVIESQKRKTGKTYDIVTASMEPYDNDTLKNEIKRAGNYFDYGGNLGRYKYSHKAVVQAGIDLNLSTYGGKGKGMESWDVMNALARGRSKTGKRLTDLAYYAEGKYVSQRMNAARCLASDKYKKLGVDTANVNAFCVKHDFSYKGGKGTYPVPEEVASAIRKDYEGKPAEVMAAVFEEICGTWVDNPFGKIGDYSLPGDTGITDLDKYGWGRRGRRGWRRHGWHGWGGGGGGGSAFTPEINKAGGPAKQTITKAKKTDIHVSSPFGTSNTSKKSNVNEAYRKKAKKLREQTRKVPKS